MGFDGTTVGKVRIIVFLLKERGMLVFETNINRIRKLNEYETKSREQNDYREGGHKSILKSAI